MNGKLEALQACRRRRLHKIVRYPMRASVCQADHRGDAFPSEKLCPQNFMIKLLWYFMMMIPNLTDIVQGALMYSSLGKNTECKSFFCYYFIFVL